MGNKYYIDNNGIVFECSFGYVNDGNSRPATETEIYNYKNKENSKEQILELKQKLLDTDYMAIKYAEGELPNSEYETVKIQRRFWRSEINRLNNMS